ncbi:FAD/NAD(P)-binding domain-containing protein [Thozetella sp. PMI_491]|nr:FAD/NAD(P)-binding domain-containing protein [Thozetella sp. PMI_491]
MSANTIESGEAVSAPAYVIKEEPIENHRQMKVRVIGAGFSGVYLGIRIPQRLRNIDLQIYDKNSGIGGTWWENRYPGCACDIPAHSYQYTFDPKPDWSGFYASSREICDYINSIAEKYGVPRFVKLHHEVTSCSWDDSLKKWHITVKHTQTGESFEEDVDVVVSARGNLNTPKWPEISGLERFQGEKMHSAAWNQEDRYDFTSKRIGIIGGGSSSIQIVPELQKLEGTRLSCFIRSKVWISDRFGDHVMGEMGLDPSQLEFTEAQISNFKNDPTAYRTFRKTIEEDGNMVHHASLQGTAMSNMFIELFSKITKKRLATKPELLPYFLPDFGVGCRRLTPGPGYLEALIQDNVEFIPTAIDSINETGVKLSDGRQVAIDVLCCATGFDTSLIPPFPVVGKHGCTLAEKFTPYPKTYLTMMVDDLPNFFIILGPNSSIGAGTLTILLEAEGDYVVKCIRKLQKEDYASLVPRQVRVQDFSDYVGEYFKRTVYMGKCKSWYKTGGGLGDRISTLWPGSILHAMETLRAPRWEDFEFESLCGHENRFRWLGNGWSETLMPGGGDPSWYLNENELDCPLAGKPEEDLRYKARPFSH